MHCRSELEHRTIATLKSSLYMTVLLLHYWHCSLPVYMVYGISVAMCLQHPETRLTGISSDLVRFHHTVFTAILEPVPPEPFVPEVYICNLQVSHNYKARAVHRYLVILLFFKLTTSSRDIHHEMCTSYANHNQTYIYSLRARRGGRGA